MTDEGEIGFIDRLAGSQILMVLLAGARGGAYSLRKSLGRAHSRRWTGDAVENPGGTIRLAEAGDPG
jgi:hypothetical protein